jgi:hypothetical protein
MQGAHRPSGAWRPPRITIDALVSLVMMLYIASPAAARERTHILRLRCWRSAANCRRPQHSGSGGEASRAPAPVAAALVGDHMCGRARHCMCEKAAHTPADCLRLAAPPSM